MVVRSDESRIGLEAYESRCGLGPFVRLRAVGAYGLHGPRSIGFGSGTVIASIE